MAIQKIKLNNVPFQGGVDLAHEIALLETGSFSQLQNVRPTRPGFIQRKGQILLHSTTADSQETLSLFQFAKGETIERHLFRQVDNGAVEEGTSNPPTITTGNFGTSRLASVLNTVAGTDALGYTCILSHVATTANKPITGADWETYWKVGTTTGNVWAAGTSYVALSPASYGNIRDMMLYSDGARQHQIYSGQNTKIERFIVYKGTTYPDIPVEGTDYTDEVTDGKATTSAPISSLATTHRIYIKTPARANKLTFAFATLNTTASVFQLKNKLASGWTTVGGFADGTSAASCAAGQDGSITWTMGEDVPHYMFGESGFWYELSLYSGAIDSNTTIISITCECPFQAIQNVWDGVLRPISEGQVYKSNQGKYSSYSVGTSLNISKIEPRRIKVLTLQNSTLYRVTVAGVDKDYTSDGTATEPEIIAGLVASINATGGYVAVAAYNNLSLTVRNTPGTDFTLTVSANLSVSTPDYIYIGAADPFWGAYLDVGSAPNTTAGYIRGTDIAFVDGGTGQDSITRITGDFVTQGFKVGQVITITGSTSNNITVMLASVGAGTMYVATGSLTAEAAGAKVTITRTAATYVGKVEMFTGDGFTTVGNFSEGVDGLAHSGFISWQRNAVTPKKHNLNGSELYMYWARISMTNDVSDNCSINVSTLPYFDIDNDFYPKGQCCAVWKGRAVYSFANDNNLYISAMNRPMVLNGDDFGILPNGAGDGRWNPVIAMRPFHNELLVWQSEKGEKGGCLSLVEGKDPSTYDKLLRSSLYGIVNAKSAVILEGVSIAEMSRDRPVATAAFWISRDGVFKTDGVAIVPVHGPIANYFDVTKTECIRAGYESKHWLAFDRAYNVIRMGLCSGSSATMANVFFVLDTATGKWSTDTLGQALSCVAEADASTGAIPVLQVGGGQAGSCYQLNTTNNDISTAIDASMTMEINGNGNRIRLNQDSIRCKVQSAGSITRTIMADGNPATKDTKTLIMTAKATNDVYRRHFKSNKIDGDHISIKWRHNTAAQPCHFLDFGIEVEEIESNPVTSDT